MQIYGIDLSKDKFDVSFVDESDKERNKEVVQKFSSIVRFIKSIPKDGIVCAEHTGVYGDMLVFLCNQFNIPIALVPGYTIKHSFGMVKGKSDPVDARRIREYGERFTDMLQFKEYDSEDMMELKTLYTLRAEFVKTKKQLQSAIHSRSLSPFQSIKVNQLQRKAFSDIKERITEVNNEIEAIIIANNELKENYEYATSVKGIGPVIATDLIIKTGNFKHIDTARKAASYAGVCPFPNSSGKMVKKSKTSPFADKKLKSILHMGARAAVKHNAVFRLYFQRKQLEGKPYYLIMNNVSNKLLRTVYSVVKNKTLYRQDFICLDPREQKNINSSEKKVA